MLKTFLDRFFRKPAPPPPPAPRVVQPSRPIMSYGKAGALRASLPPTPPAPRVRLATEDRRYEDPDPFTTVFVPAMIMTMDDFAPTHAPMPEPDTFSGGGGGSGGGAGASGSWGGDSSPSVDSSPSYDSSPSVDSSPSYSGD